MASFTVDPKTAQGAQIIRCIQLLRDTQNSIDDMANVIDNMDATQMITYTGFSGTLVQLKANFSIVQTLLNTDTNVANLIELIIW